MKQYQSLKICLTILFFMYLQPYHYPIITFEVGIVVASFSSTTLLGFVSFFLHQIYFLKIQNDCHIV